MEQKLLNTGIFIKNKYFYSYIKLISKEQKIKGYAEGHHVIPVSYYALKNNLQRVKEKSKALKLADSDLNNKLILLSYADHCKAHGLLSKCLIKEYASANVSAFISMIECVREDLTIVRYTSVIPSGLTKQEYRLLQNKITKIKEFNPRFGKQEDLNFLAENYKKYSLDELAEKLGRTKSSLKNMAQLKGIDRRRIFGTEEQNKKLKHLYLDLNKTAVECAQELGVAEMTVVKQCNKLGLKKVKRGTKEEDKFIIENDSKYTVKELAKKLNVSKAMMVSRRWALGLTKGKRTKK